ncbi:MAG: hypothetical protein GX564_03010 [Oligosphaeraceae bacterium]|nr:hypothetical protein [Oligosphaeraceae bacterium]
MQRDAIDALPLLLGVALLLSGGILFGQTALGSKSVIRNGRFADPAGPTENWSVRSSGLGSMRVVPAEAEGESNVMTVVIKQTSARPWSVELLQVLDSEVERGSTLHINFDYKMSAGYCFHFYWQVEASPWPKLLSLRLTEPVDTWHRLHVAVPIHEAYSAGQTAFSFHLAEKTGTLELRDISATLYPPGFDPETLPSNVKPVLGGDFYDNDWRELVLRKIEQHRRGQLSVQVKTGEQAVPAVKVSIRQLSSSMAFGVEASAALLMPEVLSRRELSALCRRVEPYRETWPQYRPLILENPLFSFVSFYNGFTWREHASWGSKIDQKLVQDTLAAGKSIRGHALYVPAYMFAPTACRSKNRDQLWEALMQQVELMVKRHAGKINSWEVLHGAIEYNELYNFIGVDSLAEVFKTAEKAAPGLAMLVSDLNALGEISEVPLNDLAELLAWLKTEGVSVQGLVLGMNLQRLDVAPQSMEKRLDRLQSQVGLPLHIRNLAVSGENLEAQADMIRDYMLLFFSRPEVVSLSLGELWSPALINARMGFYEADFQPRPAAAMVMKLLQDWQTEAVLVTDAEGRAEFTPYLGEYAISVEQGGRQWQQKFRLSAEQKAGEIVFELGAGQEQ